MFSDAVDISFSKGLNLLVGENGSGKSSVVDAIRALLGENEFSRRGIIEEDFYSEFCKSQKKSSDSFFISGIFSNLTEAQKVEYLSWLDEDLNAKLSFEVQRTLNKRNNYKQKRWGGNSSNSFFDVEPLNDIQCMYLPALRDAERSLRTGRGSRLARFIANLSADDLKSKRDKDELMPLEQDLKEFNEKAAKESEITNATELINSSIMSAAGNVYGQKTQIRFNTLSYERIIESLQLLFSDDLNGNSDVFRSLSENSLGYNNLIYIATILAEFEGLKDRYTTPRILLIEEMEAHLHPQLQIKLLQYLQKQAIEFDIQVIITTHSSLLAASVPFENIIALYRTKEGISITPLIECDVDKSASGFLNRWLDATKTALFFSKGNIFVEGIAEAILIPELAKVYLDKQKKVGLTKISSLEEAGISVINMNGIYFPYFMQFYNGYRVKIPDQKDGETKKDYQERINALLYNHPLFTPEFKIYSDSTVSRFLSEISIDDSIRLQNEWNETKDHRQRIYISYDSTNKNCQAGDIDIVEYGHPKDGNGGPVFNVSVAYDTKNREPLFYEEYPGSIVDVAQLQYMLNAAKGYGYKHVGFILDRGYFSQANIDYMDSSGYDFVIMVKGLKALVREAILTVQGTFENKRTYSIRKYKVNGITVRKQLYPSDKNQRFFHIYYDPAKSAAERMHLEDTLTRLEKQLRRMEGKPFELDRQMKRYYNPEYYNEGKKDQCFVTAYEREEVVEEELNLCGYFCIISSAEMTAREALDLYKSRDASEKLFRAEKSFLGGKTERVQSEESLGGKLLIGFVSLIIRNRMYTRIKDAAEEMDSTPNFMNVAAAIRELEKIEMLRGADGVYRLDHAVTKAQRIILNAFDINTNDVKSKADEISEQLKPRLTTAS